MNIAQVFYLARCASKTPEEREEIKAIEKRHAAVMDLARELIKVTREPNNHDVGSAQLILSLHHSSEAAQALQRAFGNTSELDAKRTPLVTVKHYCSSREGLESVARTEHDWAQFLSWYKNVDGLRRSDVLKALAASYRAEHAEVPEWIEQERQKINFETNAKKLYRGPAKKRK